MHRVRILTCVQARTNFGYIDGCDTNLRVEPWIGEKKKRKVAAALLEELSFGACSKHYRLKRAAENKVNIVDVYALQALLE